jgi:uncharacterized protein (DUF697 family)
VAGIPLNPFAVLRAAKDISGRVGDVRPVVLSGAPGPVRELHAALVHGGDPGAVRDTSARALSDGDLAGAGILVHVLEGAVPTAADEATLRHAARKGVELVAVAIGGAGDLRVPYVLAGDVVAVPGPSVEVEPVAERIAARVGHDAFVLAAALPALRRSVAGHIVATTTRRNALIGAAVFIPGVDLAALTLNQIGMVLRIAAAYGEPVDRERAVEVLAVVGAAFGWRGLARQLVVHVPGPRWLFKGGVAAAGTKAVGEAAIAYFESRAVRSGS